jgi:hypothetical protein
VNRTDMVLSCWRLRPEASYTSRQIAYMMRERGLLTVAECKRWALYDQRRSLADTGPAKLVQDGATIAVMTALRNLRKTGDVETTGGPCASYRLTENGLRRLESQGTTRLETLPEYVRKMSEGDDA